MADYTEKRSEVAAAHQEPTGGIINEKTVRARISSSESTLSSWLTKLTKGRARDI